ncbi:MAG: Ig-like domain-containing protein, partial [Ardenticatenaceae bacterium]
LTQAENDALGGRRADVAAFVNGGGGLLGFTSDFPNPYPYLADVGTFTFNTGLGYSDITPTPAGLAIGITDALDVCCWHDEYLTFPIFLEVLAVNVDTGNAAAVGGADVFISDIQLDPPAAVLEVGTSHVLTATVVENNLPVPGEMVTFTVLSGPNAGTTGMGTTDANGIATFSYTSTTVGIDTIEASFTDSQGNLQLSNQVTAEWIAPPGPQNCLLNASFEQDSDGNGIPDGWAALNLGQDDRLTDAVAYEGAYSFEIVGRRTARKALASLPCAGGSAGQQHLVSGWSRSEGAQLQGYYGLAVRYTYTDGTVGNVFLPFGTGDHGWQPALLVTEATRSYDQVQFLVLYSRQRGVAWFDQMRLMEVLSGQRPDGRPSIPAPSRGTAIAWEAGPELVGPEHPVSQLLDAMAGGQP